MDDFIESVKRIWDQFISLPTIYLEGVLFIPPFVFGAIIISFPNAFAGTRFVNFAPTLFFIFLGLPFWVAIFRREFIGKGRWKGTSAFIFGIIAVAFTWGMGLFWFWQAIIKMISK